ncbi:MAG TPA: DUF3078 domain-containing protein [Bacteroidales bacterium]|nr:DUF3078 domain-containing protein [Bacteroidales bacterium]HSA44347.1 DUF3078 domain-containing protein [Bacteroidales bacterium]
MKKKHYLLLLLLTPIFMVHAQNDTLHWKKSLQTGLNLNQASFSDNWKGGGVNSIALGTFLNATASYSDKKKITFDNDLQLAYGFVQNKGQTARKSQDKIFFDSKLGYKIAKNWNLFASVNFSSQFDAGFEYKKDQAGAEYAILLSKFMAPGYLTSSIGLEYKPVDYFWARFGTGTLRQTFVLDTALYQTNPKYYGLERGKKVRSEVAFQFIANFDKDIATNLNLKTRFSALAPYENIGRIVSRLDATLTAKVNKYINVNLTGTMLNDPDMDDKVQYSQGFALGILFNM